MFYSRALYEQLASLKETELSERPLSSASESLEGKFFRSCKLFVFQHSIPVAKVGSEGTVEIGSVSLSVLVIQPKLYFNGVLLQIAKYCCHRLQWFNGKKSTFNNTIQALL